MPQEEYIAELRKEAQEGLYDAVKRRVYRIEGECRDMELPRYMTVREWLLEILELVKGGKDET